MSLNIALQMDPIERVNIDKDTSFALALEAKRRGHTLYYYHPADLFYESGQVCAKAQKILDLKRSKGNHVTLAEPEKISLEEMNIILLRQDPPFDMAYITTTYLLERLEGKTLVINNPASVRNHSEKLMVLDFPDLIPETLITRDKEAIKNFRAKHKDIILKPLYGCAGQGVFRLTPDDSNFTSVFEALTATSKEPIIAQPYLPANETQNKRVILIDGQPVGGLKRQTGTGETRVGGLVGGGFEKYTLSPRDLEICAQLGPILKAQGLMLVGIDIIGDYLIEINVTSPTLVQQIEQFDGIDICKKFWDIAEEKYASLDRLAA